MKNYPKINQKEAHGKTQQKLDELLLFQELLRSSEEMNVRYHGKALEIADSLNSWIEALRRQMKG